MRRPTHRLLIAAPAAAYLALLAVVGAFVAHPSTLGWIGFAVVAAVAALVTGLAATLAPRSRANARRERPRVGDRPRLLVVAETHCGAEALADAVLDRAPDRDVDVAVVAPVRASPLHFLAEEESAERAPAAEILLVVPDSGRTWLEQRLERTVRDAYGVHVTTLTARAADAARGG